MSDKFHIDPWEKEVLLDKYLRGDCTPEETAWIHSWFRQLNSGGRQWQDKSANEQQKYLADLYRDISYSIANEDKKPRVKRLRRNIIRIAASLVLICGISLLFFHRYNTGKSGSAEKYITEESAAGMTKELRLPDGSLIWLNGGTTLRYPEVFTAGTREVFLEGEAFFEVARDVEKPFIIRTKEMQTRVLGTSFNVQAYDDQKAARVVVVAGAVEVSLAEDTAAGNANAGKEKLILAANEMATLIRSKNVFKAEKTNSTAQYTAWKDGKLVFSQTPMSEVAQRLERAFGLKIEMENPAIERCEITGRFDKNQEASLTIEAICRSIEAGYRIESGTVYIQGQGCER